MRGSSDQPDPDADAHVHRRPGDHAARREGTNDEQALRLVRSRPTYSVPVSVHLAGCNQPESVNQPCGNQGKANRR
jgi:hypothetical protein